MLKMVYLLVSAIIAIMALFYTWLRIEQIRYGYLISQRYEHLIELRRTNEKLNLELNYLTSPAHLQEIAQKEFSMRPPKSQEIILIQLPSSILKEIQQTEPTPRPSDMLPPKEKKPSPPPHSSSEKGKKAKATTTKKESRP
jgi:cell division protein FtsL